jgi:hypothetical protein
MLTNWHRSFPDCEPVAHQLRVAFRERWVRFHSLPESKRYPENAAEYATILERHNRILGELVQNGQAVALLTTGYSDTPEPIRTYAALVKLDPQALPWRTVAMHEVDEDFGNPSYWHIFVSQQTWKPGNFDALVRLIADDVLANVMMVALDCRWLVHPYDGGMDVILESRTARDKLSATYPQWLSARADGM